MIRRPRPRGRTDAGAVSDESGPVSPTGIERGLKGRRVDGSASRDSQVRPTAQRSGRCLVGVRRFKSCSLHFFGSTERESRENGTADLSHVSRSGRALRDASVASVSKGERRSREPARSSSPVGSNPAPCIHFSIVERRLPTGRPSAVDGSPVRSGPFDTAIPRSAARFLTAADHTVFGGHNE